MQAHVATTKHGWAIHVYVRIVIADRGEISFDRVHDSMQSGICDNHKNNDFDDVG